MVPSKPITGVIWVSEYPATTRKIAAKMITKMPNVRSTCSAFLRLAIRIDASTSEMSAKMDKPRLSWVTSCGVHSAGWDALPFPYTSVASSAPLAFALAYAFAKSCSAAATVSVESGTA